MVGPGFGGGHVSVPGAPGGPDDRFVTGLIPLQTRLFRYIAGLVPARADAEDLFQKSMLTAWQERGRYAPDRDLFAWLCGIARNHVRHHVRAVYRARAVLDPEVIEQLADRLLDEDGYFQRRQAALTECLGLLPDKSRALVEQVYGAEQAVKDVARQLGAGVEGVYKALQRVRAALHDCVTARLDREGGG
jgi:RNA polymerase sigma-70 factor (ECF subfamily)